MDSSTSGASRLVLLSFGKYRNTMVMILSVQQKWSIKVLMALVLLACYHNSIRVRSYLLRAALVPPSLSPWRKLYDEGDSSSFLHVTGLTREAFDSLLYVVMRIGDYKICVDQGFPRSGDATGILFGPIPERSAQRLHPLVRDNLIRLSNVYTSLRQASEWGMRGLQGTFSRCKNRLPSNKEKRRRVLEFIILVHNFRTEVVGHNQISAVFVPEYEQVINIHGYDRIRRYYLEPGDYETDNEAELLEENFENDEENEDGF